MRQIFFFYVLILFFAFELNIFCEGPKLNVIGYIDSYFATDNDKLDQENVQASRQLTFLNPYKNQISLNMALIQLDMSTGGVRGLIALQAGDFVSSAYLSTRNQILQQANVGYNIFDDFWIDAGYFLTHIGGESVLPKDNWLSSHSIVTFFEPFFQSGIKASYEGNKLNVQLHLLNANGLYEDNNDNKTFGLFVGYNFSDDINISYANIIGNEEPGGVVGAKTLMLHNVVAKVNITEDLTLKGQVDYATKEKAKIDPVTKTQSDGIFLGFSLTGHYQLLNNFGTTFRFASTDNSEAVFFPMIKGMAYTLGFEYKPSESSYIRLEGSMFNMSDDESMIFTNSDGIPEKSKMEIILNFGLLLKNY